MDPATISIVLGLLLKYGPTLTQQIVILFHKKEPTLDDWIALLDSVRSYEEMDAASKLRMGTVTVPTPTLPAL